MPEVDAVLVCWKAHANRQLPEMLPPLLGEDTLVVFLQNGIGAEQDLARDFPTQPIAAGLAFLCANRVAPGAIDHLDYGMVLLAPRRDADLAATRALAACFTHAGVPVDVDGDLLAARWQKLVWNMPYNGLCALHGVDTARLMADAELAAEARAIMLEVEAAAHASGHPTPAGIVDTMLERTRRMRPYRPSMQLDREAGRRLELDAIYARPLAIAARHGVSMPRTQAWYHALQRLGG